MRLPDEWDELDTAAGLGPYSGGDWTVAIGVGGRKGVFNGTAKADFDNLVRQPVGSDSKWHSRRALCPGLEKRGAGVSGSSL